MVCHHRRRTFFIKIVGFVSIVFLLIIPLRNLTVRQFVHDNKKNPLEIYSDSFVNLKSVNLPENEAEHRTLKIDVPHWSDAFQDLSRLPGYGEPGEWGMPFVYSNTTKEEQGKEAAGWERNAFNQFASDRISLHRYLPDVRHKGCRNETYSWHLLKTSVIICFHNEAWSVLLRTVHSILDRTEPDLLEEIILVDDFSDLPHLKKDLDDYIAPLGKVKLIRAAKREGLIRARLMGASAAKAPVLTFLDSHCECTHGWLEPLLQQIQDNPNTVAAPVIDIIDDTSFQYHIQDTDNFIVGGFNWNLQFEWHFMTENEKAQRNKFWDPIRTPTIAGGLFSIKTEFFNRIGRYDDGFKIWGGENLELSFKTWMCNGSLEIIPCSHVGHVFRNRIPYDLRPGQNVFRQNRIRLAEVWLDDYKNLFYRRLGNDARMFIEQKQYGDISSRIELRERLQCNSFDWYLKNVYPEQYVPGELVAEGEIRNLGDGADTCLDSKLLPDDFDKPIKMLPCHLNGGSQYFWYTKLGEIRRDRACLDYDGAKVLIYMCHGLMGNQKWIYDPASHYIKHDITEKCLEMKTNKIDVTAEVCDGNPRQLWGMQSFEPTKLYL